MKENYVFRRLLNLPIVYRLFEDFIAKKNGRQIFMTDMSGMLKENLF